MRCDDDGDWWAAAPDLEPPPTNRERFCTEVWIEPCESARRRVNRRRRERRARWQRQRPWTHWRWSERAF